MTDRFSPRQTKWRTRLVSRKHTVCRFKTVSVPSVNIRNGLRAMVKTVGTELIVKTTLAILISISIVSSGAVMRMLPCWA